MEKEMDYGYKDEIRSTRVGSMGSSDGAMLMRIASLGHVPDACMERMAVCKGLIDGVEIPQTPAVRYGDYIENAIYRHLVAASGLDFESNPLLESSSFSRVHVRLISHPDIYCEDAKNHVLWLYEVKTTKDSVEETRYKYKAQLFIHYTLGREKAVELSKRDGVRWRVKLVLVHYDTNGLDLDASDAFAFDPDRISMRDVKINSSLFDLGLAMDLVDACVSAMDEYYPSEEVNADMLPDKVRREFDSVVSVLREIKEREKTVAEFKQRLYGFMSKNNIKSVKCDAFTMTRVDASESHSFDAKRFLDDYSTKYPRKAKKLMAEFDRVTKKNGYVTIKEKVSKEQ